MGRPCPPFRETRNYVSNVNSLAGAAANGRASSGERTRIYRVVEAIDGREIIKYTDSKPTP